MRSFYLGFLFWAGFFCLLLNSQPVAAQAMASPTRVVLLGTGTPFADPEKSGPSLAIVVNNTSYVIDCGPGVVRRASAAAAKGIPALKAAALRKLFITHLHTDHTAGYSDFIFTPAVLDRNAPLDVFGPKGTQQMTDHILQAYKEDIEIRIKGLEYGDPAGYRVNVQEISPGVIYRDSNITVKAFRVHHGSWEEAYGFRFETPDKVIVVSGDCTYSEELVKHAENCDILIHEVYSEEGLARREKRWQDYHSTFHTSTSQLAEIANRARPGLLVLTHQLLFGATEESLLREIRSKYAGKLISGKDLDIF